MDSLEQLINKHGEPDALIDHWDNNSKKMAIWGFDEILVYDVNGMYHNGKKITGDPLRLCNDILNKWDDNSSLVHAIGYISYDMKNYLFPHLKFKDIPKKPLIWFGKPKLIAQYQIDTNKKNKQLNNSTLYLEQEIPDINYYRDKIAEIKSYLKLGETYQINYSNPIKHSYSKSKFNLYLYLRDIAKPANGMYLNTGKNQFLSMSPEKFFEIKNNKISTYPIKGTIKRSQNTIKDNKLRIQLKNSEKDKAEHLMIVDLLRNDLGKICKYGSIEVNKLYNIKSFETIHHMETEVSGDLLNNINFQDIITALFPSGSITGAPKERSMEIIDEIENYNREIYTGSIGYLAKKGYMNFNVAIRTMSFNKNKGTYPVGGGIVWDSTAEGERLEALDKAKIIDNILEKKIEKYA